MNPDMIIRAWKDPTYRAGLSEEQRAALPESPSGKPLSELDEGELEDVVGGVSIYTTTINTRPTVTITTQLPTRIFYCRTSLVDACPTFWGCPPPLTY
jgi:mersacidin/lichenicidin family type 2 lantibiotic